MENKQISFNVLLEKILRRGKTFLVTDESGKKVLGTHGSRKKAQKQLAAIEISKKKRRKKR
jgi:hypothetical protein